MNKIIATDRFETQNGELNLDDLGPYYNDLFIGFTDESPIVSFQNLEFGLQLRQGDQIQHNETFPPYGAQYIQTDQDYLECIRLITNPDQTYQLFLGAENDNIRVEKEFELLIPRPEAPFASWIGNTQELVGEAPVPYPTDDKLYQGDDEAVNGVETEEV